VARRPAKISLLAGGSALITLAYIGVRSGAAVPAAFQVAAAAQPQLTAG
jgi:hypothetical protein